MSRSGINILQDTFECCNQNENMLINVFMIDASSDREVRGRLTVDVKYMNDKINELYLRCGLE